MIGEEGPDHAKQFLVKLTIGTTVYGTGKGSTKKAAEQEAAYQALLALSSKEKPDVSEKY